MANNYQFLDAYSSVQTAASSVVAGAHEQKVQISSTVTLPVTLSGSPSISGTINVAPGSVSGVGIFDVNHIGNGSIITAPQPASVSGVGVFNVENISSVKTAPNPGSVSGVGIFNVNHTGNGSILTVSLGSIMTVPQPGSVSGVGLFNVNHTGNGSIIGVVNRNDTLASTLGVDGTYRPIASDSVGRILIKPFASNEARVQGITSTVNASVTQILAGAGAGLRNYITDVAVSNSGSVTTVVTFRDGDASIIGRTIAPATGGSNMIGFNTPMRTGGFNQQVDIINTVATSILHVTVYGYKAP